MPRCETVRVKADNDQGFIIINKCDLTDDHVLFDDTPEEPVLFDDTPEEPVLFDDTPEEPVSNIVEPEPAKKPTKSKKAK